MHGPWKRRLLGIAVVLACVAPVARAAMAADPNKSPALCGTADTPETGMQGDVPLADQASGRKAQGYNCGLALVSEVPDKITSDQTYQHCAYVRIGSGRPSDASGIKVYDLTDPANPVHTADLPVFAPMHGSSSETMRAVAARDRAILISGTGLYDISNCAHPVVKGQIPWPGLLPWPAGLSHDIRITFDGRKVWAGLGVVEADIDNLNDPSTWVVKNHTCEVARQYHPLHEGAAAADVDLCATPWQDWMPQIAHGPGVNADGTRVYVGNQLALAALNPGEDDAMRILDVTGPVPRIVATFPGPGHAVDWFRTGGHEYLLHSNEIVYAPQTSCTPYPRPSSLGWAYGAYITDITHETKPTEASYIELAINKPENCSAKLASGQNTQVAYHSVDNPTNAKFAMVSMGNAGLRLFDIRHPKAPKEVAYYNIGSLQHASVSQYDAARGLLTAPGPNGLLVLELEPQVIKDLGLPKPTDPAYPRYAAGRAARPPAGSTGVTAAFPATFGPLPLPVTAAAPAPAASSQPSVASDPHSQLITIEGTDWTKLK